MAHYRQATLADCMKLAPILRDADKEELKLSSGEEPLEALILSLQISEECNAILSDEGNVIGMFGVATVDEDLGSPWLLGSDGIKDISKDFIKGSHAWLKKIQDNYTILFNYVHESNAISIRWLKALGFVFVQRVEKFGVGEAPFYEFMRIKGIEDHV